MIRKQIQSINTALKIYYEYPEIGNKEITALFGNMSSSTMTQMKRAAKEHMIENDIKTYVPNTVNTEIAFKVWGIDIEDLEKRRSKIIKLGLV